MPDFNAVLHDIISVFGSAGNFGVLMTTLLILVLTGLTSIIWIICQFNNFRVASYKERLEEHKLTGDKLVGIIENNTAAMTQMSVAVDNCTQSVQQTHNLYEELKHFIKDRLQS